MTKDNRQDTKKINTYIKKRGSVLTEVRSQTAPTDKIDDHRKVGSVISNSQTRNMVNPARVNITSTPSFFFSFPPSFKCWVVFHDHFLFLLSRTVNSHIFSSSFYFLKLHQTPSLHSTHKSNAFYTFYFRPFI